MQQEANWTHCRNGRYFFWVTFIPAALLVFTATCAACMAAEEHPVVLELGTRVAIDSKILDRSMDLIIHLPAGYNIHDEKCPVIFMIGSEYRTHFALFASCMDYMRDGGQIPPMILIGIDLPDGNSILVPWKHDASKVDQYLHFLTDEVIPHIRANYRTAPFWILYGSSNGGVFSLYSLLANPGAINAYIASSPMLGWCMDFIREIAMKAHARAEERTRYLFLVHSDDDYREVREFVPEFVSLLEEMGPRWMIYESVIRPSGGHVSVVDLPLAMKWLFPDYSPPSESTSLNSITHHFRVLSERYEFEMLAPASLLFDSGVDNILAQKLELAEEIFEYFIELYPKDPKGHIGLGMVRRDQNQQDEANILWRRALELDPESGLARRLLDRM